MGKCAMVAFAPFSPVACAHLIAHIIRAHIIRGRKEEKAFFILLQYNSFRACNAIR